jgi:hypothetical protein
MVLGASTFLTVLFVLLWIAGFIFGQTLGGLIHLLFAFSFFTFLGMVVGVVMLIVSLVRKE